MKFIHDVSGNVVIRTLQIVLPLQITGQPRKQVAAAGEIVTFSVVVADTRAATFQWRFNGADIPGATGDSLLLTNVSTANEGLYSVVVTNTAGSVTSDPAALLLHRDPTVSTSTPPQLIVYSDEGGFVAVTPMQPSYNPGETVTLTATPLTGSVFVDWVGDLNTSNNPVTLTMDGNKTMRARFVSALPRLIAYSGAGGTVAVAPMKLGYALGEMVTLTATPFVPYVFAGWTGDLNSSNNPDTLTMNGNKTVRARFAVAAPLLPGLVALWRGETDASDLIGGHHGAFFAGADAAAPSVTPAGKVGGAFSFDGTMHVRVPDSAELRPAQLTVEAWVFPTAPHGSPGSVVARWSSGNTWDLRLGNNIPQFWSHGGQGLEGPSAIPQNEWTHLAISFDGMTKRLYVNGTQVAESEQLRALAYDAAPVPVTIGSVWENNASGYRFNGRIDEVALYNRALTADEVFGIYNAGSLGKNFSQPYFTSPSQLPRVVLGAGYTQQLTTVLGTAPVSFSLSEGALPPGLTLSSTGLVSGAPSMPGVFDFTVRATDAAGASTEQLCVLRVLQPVVPPANLVAWWRGEPAAGGVASDIIGGHDGSFFSGNVAAAPAHTADGKVGSAFALDGALYVRVLDAVELRPPAMTVETWIFPTKLNTDANNFHMVIARGSSTFWGAAWYLGLNAFGGRPRFSSNHSGAAAIDELEGLSAIPLNEWTHLAATFDGATKRLYVNGVEAAWKGGLRALVYDATPEPVTIGAYWVSSAPVNLFIGRIDEVSFYSRALSAAEIFSLADAGPAGKSTVGL